jgi:uncharacterized membrane protein YqiK
MIIAIIIVLLLVIIVLLWAAIAQAEVIRRLRAENMGMHMVLARSRISPPPTQRGSP